jgi:hypothetical protein
MSGYGMECSPSASISHVCREHHRRFRNNAEKRLLIVCDWNEKLGEAAAMSC